MPEDEKPIFTVDASGEPAVLRIDGRASYLTSAPVNHLFNHLLNQGKCKFILDFRKCTGMDSTFLGILAGAAMRVKREFPEGYLELCNLNTRNLELVRNLGLHRILTVVSSMGEGEESDNEPDKGFESLPNQSVESRSMLEAHRNLVDADRSNAAKFEDVIKFLEKETE
ncbi:STAS domain-containing protein [Puniceicoccus vermicola]|uniref:STAS domain-containing protein n=1 Tax=Puniceicoccus vermicola TaxID=388746 RepID=A0A7X1AWA3_9BACT|nr:STAS domain-containing protein [Puniceicoccus vermicola]MBC2600954.1 STAS domain-containing protein [Puniceicoccus vermicola]